MMKNLSPEDQKRLRREAGDYVKSCREAAGLTQQELSKKLHLDYYTFVSQVENGRTRVPPDRQRDWAMAVGVHPTVFAKRLLAFYDPYTWDVLYGKGSLAEN